MASQEHSDHAQTIFPGYQQVEEFGPDEDYEEGEETAYVTLDLGNVEPTLVPSASSYYLIGLDTPTPFLQLQGTVRHPIQNAESVHEHRPNAPELHRRAIQHVANTEQRIVFKEVTLQPRPPPASQKHQEVPSEPTELSKSSDSTAQVAILDVDGQRIERMTGKAAPLARLPRTKSSSKKQSAHPEDRTAQPSKGKEKEAPDPDPIVPEPDLGSFTDEEAT
ncbi:hypothetical protein NMY22_g1053 [Coprinellus aureogranulatus]|nr:hypothetical protein NMY22_g1053 [Coprinellus aureogranulatus]